MKRLLILLLITFAYSPLLAEDLPVLWLEAGKETEVQLAHLGAEQDWTLQFEHRTLVGGKLLSLAGAATPGQRSLTVKTPSVKPGICVQAKLFFADVHVGNVVIASPDPFEDRKAWCENHPIALYDPERGFSGLYTTTDLLMREEIAFTPLKSFADIENCTDAVIVVAGEIDFEKQRGLADVLYEKAAAGHSVLIVAPKGDIPLSFHPAIHSLKLLDHRGEIMPNLPNWGRGDAWTFQEKQGQVVLSPQVVYPTNIPGPAKIVAVGPKILDVVFIVQERSSDYDAGRPVPKGRLYIDHDSIFEFWDARVEKRWYFKSLIETLTQQRNEGRAVTP